MSTYSHSGTAADESSDSAHRAAVSGSETSRSQWERVGAAVLGGGLLVFGLRRRSPVGTAIALVGGWVSYRAISGSGRHQEAGSHTAAGRDRDESAVATEGLTVTESTTIGKPAEELSELARDSATLDRLVGDVADVTPVDDDHHRWTVHGPLDRELSWETQLVEDRSGELLRWESTDDAAFAIDWSVQFRSAPGDRGTAVTVQAHVDPPGGTLGSAAMRRLDIVPDALLGQVLDRFKSLAETGEIPTVDRNPSARGRGDLV